MKAAEVSVPPSNKMLKLPFSLNSEEKFLDRVSPVVNPGAPSAEER